MAEVRTTSSTGGQKGVKLERHDLIPMGPLTKLAEHFGKGALKYDEHQWRQGYEWSKSYSAMQRHLTAFWAGFDYDICKHEPDNCAIKTASGEIVPINYFDARDVIVDGRVVSIQINGFSFEPGIGTVNGDTCYNHTGSHHMTAVAWHSFVLLEFVENHPEHDDRYTLNTPDPDQPMLWSPQIG